MDDLSDPPKPRVYQKRGTPDPEVRQKLSEAMKEFNRRTGKPSMLGQALNRRRQQAKKGK